MEARFPKSSGMSNRQRDTGVRVIVCAPVAVAPGSNGPLAPVVESLAGQLSKQLLEDDAIWRPRRAGIERRQSTELQMIRGWAPGFLARFSSASP